MPRAKSDESKTSEELNVEIAALQEAIAKKRKARDEAKKKETLAAEQARKAEQIKFNSEFVEMAKTIRLGDYEDDNRTIYDIIKYLIRPPQQVPEPVQVEPVQEIQMEQDTDPLGPSLEDTPNRLVGMTDLLQRRNEQDITTG